MNHEIRSLWARTKLRVYPERFVIVSLAPSLGREASALAAVASPFACFLVECDEVSLTIPESAWLQSPLRTRATGARTGFRALTLDLDLDLDVSGYLAPAAERLARKGVAIVPQCGFLKDHLLVAQDHLATAVAVLEGLIEECRQGEAS